MRTVEWIVVLSFVPLVGLPGIPLAWRRRWLTVAATLPLGISLLQLLIEGWRIQMLPLNVLALILLLWRIPEIRHGPRASLRRVRGIIASCVTLGFVVVGAGLAGWLLPVVKFPEPTGPYAVGIVDREIVDQSRNRRVMVSVWYPAEQHGPPAPLTHHPDAVMEGLGEVLGVPSLAFQHLRYVTVSASEQAPILKTGQPFPVVVFSHGMIGLRFQSTPLFQELASWGYVVVSVDHTDAAAITTFPDGEVRPYNLERFHILPSDGEVTRALIEERMLPVWVADHQIIYDTLERWTVDDPFFAGSLDSSKFGSFGHSFGGATALEVCRIDVRCKAAANLDGALYGESLSQPATRPVLLMTSTDSNQFPQAVTEWGSLLERAQGPAYWMEIPNSNHLSFTIAQFLSPILVSKGFEPVAGLQTMNAYLRAFFDTHIREVAAIPLGPVSKDTEVYWRTH